MKNILIIGNGAREHIIIETLKKFPCKIYSYLAAKNPGIINLSENFIIGNLTNVENIVSFGVKNNIDFAVIGPEAPLEVGVVDELNKHNIPSIGPSKTLAKLETSKSFTRNLLSKYNIEGNPKFKVFYSLEGIKEFIQEEQTSN